MGNLPLNDRLSNFFPDCVKFPYLSGKKASVFIGPTSKLNFLRVFNSCASKLKSEEEHIHNPSAFFILGSCSFTIALVLHYAYFVANQYLVCFLTLIM